MSRCTDKSVGDKLHAFELGQLTDDERREVMAHLCECEFCFEKAQKFLKTAQLFHGDSQVRSEIEHLTAGTAEDSEQTRSFESLTTSMTVSHYKIISKIGAGGMGEVFLAEDTLLDRKVAVKFLPLDLCTDENCRSRFKREAQAAAKLDHPNIVTIHEVGEHNGRPYIVMQYLGERSLDTIITDEKMQLNEIIDLTKGIANGLAAAHQAGIIHRDIKPANILVDSSGTPKLVDFGLAYVAGATKLTATGSTMGTLEYMSPEQAEGRQVDARSDIFSLGVIMYRMITGKKPFTGEYTQAIIYSILNDEPEPLARYKSGIPDNLQNIVSKMLAKDPSLRYQTAADLVADLNNPAISRISPPATKEKVFSSRIIRIGLPAVAAIIIFMILMLRPWRLEIGPTQEAVAFENMLAVMYFVNLAEPQDDSRMGEIISDLIINDIAESHYVTVLSSQRLYDILKLAGNEGLKNVPRDMATQIANKAHARWMLTGSILQLQPTPIITSQLVDVQSGTVMATQKVTGDQGDDVFTMVDRLTAEIKGDLSLPAEALQEYDPQVRTITTASTEAYRYYLEGMEYYYKYFTAEATEAFQKAVAIDSTFALAYFRLFLVGPKPGESIGLAMKYIDNANDLQQRFIRAANEWHHERYTESIEIFKEIAEKYPDEKEIYVFLGRIYDASRDRQAAIASYRRVLEIDPLYKRAYNSLVYLYRDDHNYDEALWAINKYIDLAPDEPMPYVTRGILYAHSGQLENAITSFKKVIAMRPSAYIAYEKLGDMYMFTGQYDAADSIYRLGGALPNQSGPRFLQSRIARHRGQFNKALRLLQEHIDAQKGTSRYNYAAGWSHLFRCAINDIYFDKQEAALHEALTADSLMKDISLKFHDLQNMKGAVAIAYNRAGYIAQADSVLDIIRELSERAEIPQDERYAYFKGRIAFDRGVLDTAIYYLEIAYELTPRFPEHYDLARAYFAAGRLADATKAYETMLNRYDFLRANWPDWSAEAHYHLGICYEESGWNDKAIEQYEIFLRLWEEADTELPLIDDADERLSQLRKNL